MKSVLNTSKGRDFTNRQQISSFIMNDLSNLAATSHSAHNYTIGVSVFCLISLGVGVFGGIVVILVLLLEEDKYMENYSCQYIYKGIVLGLTFILFFLIIGSASRLGNIPDKYSDFQKDGLPDCSDYYTNDAFLKFHQKIASAKPLIYWSIFFTLIIVGLITYLIILICYTPRYAPRQEEQNQNQDDERVFFF